MPAVKNEYRKIESKADNANISTTFIPTANFPRQHSLYKNQQLTENRMVPLPNISTKQSDTYLNMCLKKEYSSANISQLAIPVRHYSHISKQCIYQNSIHMPTSSHQETNKNKVVVGCTKSKQLTNRRYYYRPMLSYTKFSSVSLLDIKKFLRSISLHFDQSNACLKLSIPKHALMFDEDMGENKPDTRWKNVETELTSIYINKTTGGYVCPELALAGEWKQLQSFLVSWAKNRTKKAGRTCRGHKCTKKYRFRVK